MSTQNPDSQHASTYLALRRSVGWIGIILPLVLMLGNWLIFSDAPALRSISQYYHSGMRDVLVGGLCAIALFLFFYSGYDWMEDWLGNIGGLFAVGVALFAAPQSGRLGAVGVVHYVSAIALFLALALFSLCLFSRARPHSPNGKQWRVVVHYVCGGVMLACVAAIIVYVLFVRSQGHDSCFALIVETIALEAFGVSWLVEGRSLAEW